ncbi:hypothetical protein ACFL5M_01965 [Candidatus Neomarinimicrobiota bacterium]
MSIHKVLLLDRNRLLPVFVLLLSILPAPRLVAQYTHDVISLSQGYVLTQLSGQGIAGAVESSLANLTAANPALLADYPNICAGLSLQAETEIKPGWIADIGYRRPPKRLVQAAGIVLPLERMRIGLGLGYFQKYSAEMLFDSLKIRTPFAPDGTGEYVKPYENTIIDTWTLSGTFSKRHILSTGDQMSAALSVHLNNLDYYASFGDSLEWYDEDARQFTFAAGWIYASPEDLGCRVKLGIHYELGADIRGTGKYSGTRDWDLEQEDEGQFALTARTPTRLYTGIKIELGQRLSLTTGNNWVAWEEVRDNVINQHEYTLSLAFRWSSSLITTVGIFSTDMKHLNWGLDIPSDDAFKATYLLFGLSKQLGPLSLDAVIADSHRNSGAWIERTILKLGLGVTL